MFTTEADSVSALTGSILPDPKLLHEGRHAVIGQADTQHVPLGRSRPTHQEGLQDNAGELGGMDIKKKARQGYSDHVCTC